MSEHYPSKPGKLSRGQLILDFVKSDFFNENNWTEQEDGQKYLEKISPQRLNYNAFNLVVGNLKGKYPNLTYLHFETGQIFKIAKDQFQGLSNSLFDQPLCKVRKTLSGLWSSIAKQPKELIDLMKMALGPRNACDEHEHKNKEGNVFIKPYWYPNTYHHLVGTKSQTILTVDWDNHFEIWERSFEPIFEKLDLNSKICKGRFDLKKDKLLKWRRAVRLVLSIQKSRKTGLFKLREFEGNFCGYFVEDGI
jgi:uncharacterized protein with NRDE domain